MAVEWPYCEHLEGPRFGRTAEMNLVLPLPQGKPTLEQHSLHQHYAVKI